MVGYMPGLVLILLLSQALLILGLILVMMILMILPMLQILILQANSCFSFSQVWWIC